MDRRDASTARTVAAASPVSRSLALPPFWPSDPELWFAVAEAQFAAKAITGEKTMFYHVVSCISSDVAAEVRDLVVDPPAERAFETLKQRLIQRAPSLEQRRLQDVLSTEELSECTPSDLLRRLRQLLGSRTRSVNDPLLREAFLRRLSPTVRGVLGSAEDMSLDVLAQLADKIAEVAAASSTLGTVGPDVSTEVQRLRSQVSKLSKLVDMLETLAISSVGPRRRARSKSPSSTSPATASSRGNSQPQQLKECWYHRRYGDQAANCMPPCVRKGKGPTSR